MRTLTPITATNELTGTGNGMNTVFPLLYQGVQVFDPVNLNVYSVYKTDWQGNQRLYATPRTNLVKQSQNLSASPWVASATVSSSSSTYAGTIPYYNIANTSTTVNNGISIAFGQSFVAGQNVVLTVALRAYASTVATVGISGTADSWGSPSNAVCNILSGPGTIHQVPSSGSLFTISGLSSTQDTLVQVTRTYAGNESDGGVYIYPGDYAAIAGATWVAPHFVATNAQFGTGNGSATSFQLSVGGIPVYNNIVVSSIYRNDWQGNQLLYSAARTNVITASQDLSSASWGKNNAPTITTDVAIAPDGTMTADLLSMSSNASCGVFKNNVLTGLSVGSPVYFTAFLKFGSGSGQQQIRYEGAAFTPNLAIVVNTQTGAIISQSAGVSSATVTALPQAGWFMVQALALANAAGAANLTLYAGTTATTANYVWGCMVSQTPGAYIPTTTSAVTITDYALGSNGIVSFGQTPVSGAQLTWNGSGDSYTSILAGRVQCEYGTAGTAYIATAGSAITTTDYTVNPYGSITLSVPPLVGATLTWSGSSSIYLMDSVKTLLAQYANSPTIDQWVDFFNQWIDPAVDIDNFFNYCWNVLTAQGFGLDNWGVIVGVTRTITLSAIPNYLGFEEALPGSQPWNQAPWYGGATTSQVFTLSDAAFRTLILTKALANISNFTAPSINHLLQFLFAGRGSCYVLELSPMQIQYVFNFALQSWEASVLLQPSLMPRPAGVGVTITVNA